ncbi:MAG: GNAT family N-acetyltransferase [Micromonosporaceae bacterium]|nr:GNAT family N-acetyltransferase [Micromonosporaceae bacterium]
MTPTLHLRTAVPSDVDVLLAWRREIAAWITQTIGSDQWSTPYPRERLAMWIDRGETAMVSLSPDSDPIATITASTWGDPELWTDEELKVPAHYLYKLSVLRPYAGQGIGECLIAWARDLAAKAGSHVVRCDVWSSNMKLKTYYERQGFRYLRTEPDVNSGALFEIQATRIDGLPIVDKDIHLSNASSVPSGDVSDDGGRGV